jgi:hypothetical protein
MKTSNMVSPSASQKPSRDKSSSLNKRSKSMKHTLVRIAIGVPEAFIALSAIGEASSCWPVPTRMAS